MEIISLTTKGNQMLADYEIVSRLAYFNNGLQLLSSINGPEKKENLRTGR